MPLCCFFSLPSHFGFALVNYVDWMLSLDNLAFVLSMSGLSLWNLRNSTLRSVFAQKRRSDKDFEIHKTWAIYRYPRTFLSSRPICPKLYWACLPGCTHRYIHSTCLKLNSQFPRILPLLLYSQSWLLATPSHLLVKPQNYFRLLHLLTEHMPFPCSNMENCSIVYFGIFTLYSFIKDYDYSRCYYYFSIIYLSLIINEKYNVNM